MRRTSRFLAALAVGGALIAAPMASAQSIQGLSNYDGSVKCEFGNLQGTYIRCHSDGARATRPDCNPPQQKAPRFQYFRGNVFTSCDNQGFQATNFAPMGKGQARQIGEVIVVSDMQGGLHFASPQGYKGYIGKKAVSGPEGMGQISSRAF
ncbi:hypothetical protein [Corynebacterium sp.]|uniref:hypothetical protein n=1 Tax=Corynebacterium sp. TaxID=1720 RepID=UPI0026DBF88C|nr:hypothetical protein [Corynebacterium sp.]MDO5031810.1 hypothetical protein [Corynebacterium sp.]